MNTERRNEQKTENNTTNSKLPTSSFNTNLLERRERDLNHINNSVN